MKKLNLFTVLDVGIHALLVCMIIVLLRKMSANGLQLETWEFAVPLIVGLLFMGVVALIQTVLGRRVQ